MSEKERRAGDHGAYSGTVSRRRFLLAGVGAAAITELMGPTWALAQTQLSPDAALQHLIDGNQRFVDKRLTSFDEDLTILKENTTEKQEPFAAVLSCADSRVPVELIFDQSIGHLFVARVAGNVASSEIIASLEYGAAVLGAKAILVLGHRNCGAVKAAIEGKSAPGQISQLYAPLRPAIDASGGDLDAAIRTNAVMQAKLLGTASPLLAGLIKDGKLKVAAGYYSLQVGKVTMLHV